MCAASSSKSTSQVFSRQFILTIWSHLKTCLDRGSSLLCDLHSGSLFSFPLSLPTHTRVQSIFHAVSVLLQPILFCSSVFEVSRFFLFPLSLFSLLLLCVRQHAEPRQLAGTPCTRREPLLSGTDASNHRYQRPTCFSEPFKLPPIPVIHSRLSLHTQQLENNQTKVRMQTLSDELAIPAPCLASHIKLDSLAAAQSLSPSGMFFSWSLRPALPQCTLFFFPSFPKCILTRQKANMWALHLRLNSRLKDMRERLLGFIANTPQTVALKLNMNVPQVNY